MKNIIDVYEGILSDIDTNINKMDDDLKTASKFAYKFKLIGCMGFNQKTSGLLVSVKLKQIVRNLSLLKDSLNTDAIERGIFTGRSGRNTLNSKMRNFILWLDNIDLSQFACADFSEDSTRREFNVFMIQQLTDSGLLNTSRGNVYVTSTAVNGPDELKIMIADKNHWDEVFQLRFKISK